MLRRTKKEVKTLVGRPRQVSSVKGFRRYLMELVRRMSSLAAVDPYIATTEIGDHDRSFLGDT